VNGLTRLVVVAAAAWTLVGCGGAERPVWDPDVVRTVARRVEKSLPTRELVVLDRSVTDGLELPWPAFQSLVTAGIVVVEEAAPDTLIAALSFIDVVRDVDDWLVDTALVLPAADTAAVQTRRTRWTVRCPGESCVVADSLDLDPPVTVPVAPAGADSAQRDADTTGVGPDTTAAIAAAAR